MAFDVDAFLAEPDQPKAFDVNAFIADAPPDLSLQGVLSGPPVSKELLEAIPFSGALQQYIAGLETGKQLLGDNLAGQLTGAIFGGARAAGTALNPLSVLINAIPRATQATGSLLGGQSGTAINDILGANPIQSSATIPAVDTGIPLIDIPVNTLTGIEGEVARQPLLLAGATPRALGAQAGAVGSVASDISSAISSTAKAVSSPRVAFAKSLGREPVPILSRILDYSDSQTDKIQNVISKSPDLLPEIKSNLDSNISNVGERTIDAIGKSLENRYDTYYPAIESAPEIIVKKNLGESFRKEAVSRIKNELSESGVPEARQIEIISELSPSIDGITASNLINSTKLLNRQVAPLYKPNPTPSALANDQMIARSALRDVQSEAIHSTLKDLGIDSKIYGEVGVLNEFQGQLTKKYIAAKNDLNKTLGESLNQAVRRGLKQGVGAGVTETAERFGARLSKGKVGEIDRGLQLLFDQIEGVPANFQTGTPSPLLSRDLEMARSIGVDSGQSNIPINLMIQRLIETNSLPQQRTQSGTSLPTRIQSEAFLRQLIEQQELDRQRMLSGGTSGENFLP